MLQFFKHCATTTYSAFFRMLLTDFLSTKFRNVVNPLRRATPRHNAIGTQTSADAPNDSVQALNVKISLLKLEKLLGSFLSANLGRYLRIPLFFSDGNEIEVYSKKLICI